MKHNYSFLVILLILSLFCSCQGNQEHALQENNLPDSMPVITTPSQDSAGIIYPPTVNDSNVILPDSAIK